MDVFIRGRFHESIFGEISQENQFISYTVVPYFGMNPLAETTVYVRFEEELLPNKWWRIVQEVIGAIVENPVEQSEHGQDTK